MAFIKIASSYARYLDTLKRRVESGGSNTMRIQNNGAARYLGKVAKKSGAFSIAKDGSGNTLLILTGSIRKLGKTKEGVFYETNMW